MAKPQDETKPQRKKIEGQEVLTHQEVFDPPKKKEEKNYEKTAFVEMVESYLPPMADNSVFPDEFMDRLKDVEFAASNIHNLIASVHNLQNAFDSLKKHTQEQLAKFAKELDSATLDVPANVTGQGTLKASESELKHVANLGRMAKESVNDPLKDTQALKDAAIEAQEAYLRKTVNPGEIQFLNQSLASLRKL